MFVCVQGYCDIPASSLPDLLQMRGLGRLHCTDLKWILSITSNPNKGKEPVRAHCSDGSGGVEEGSIDHPPPPMTWGEPFLYLEISAKNVVLYMGVGYSPPPPPPTHHWMTHSGSAPVLYYLALRVNLSQYPCVGYCEIGCKTLSRIAT